jgi:hypothetical protein
MEDFGKYLSFEEFLTKGSDMEMLEKMRRLSSFEAFIENGVDNNLDLLAKMVEDELSIENEKVIETYLSTLSDGKSVLQHMFNHINFTYLMVGLDEMRRKKDFALEDQNELGNDLFTAEWFEKSIKMMRDRADEAMSKVVSAFVEETEL